jgi:hypothetical protein
LLLLPLFLLPLLLLLASSAARGAGKDARSSCDPHLSKVDAVEEGRAASAAAAAAAASPEGRRGGLVFAALFVLSLLIPVPPPHQEQNGCRNHPQELPEGHGGDLPVRGRVAGEARDDGAAKVDGVAVLSSSSSSSDRLRASLRHPASEIGELQHRRSADLRREAAGACDEGDLCVFLFGGGSAKKKEKRQSFFASDDSRTRRSKKVS